jgi:hypothetical protein
VPIPAIAGENIPLFTPAPEYIPPSGIPPFNLNGLAVVVVILSKQRVNVTMGARLPSIIMILEAAGFPVTQMRLDVMMQDTRSPDAGL